MQPIVKDLNRICNIAQSLANYRKEAVAVYFNRSSRSFITVDLDDKDEFDYDMDFCRMASFYPK